MREIGLRWAPGRTPHSTYGYAADVSFTFVRWGFKLKFGIGTENGSDNMCKKVVTTFLFPDFDLLFIHRKAKVACIVFHENLSKNSNEALKSVETLKQIAFKSY